MEQQVQMTFEEKLQKLAELAKIKKNVLENREILDFFRGEILDPEKLDRIYDFLDSQHVDVLRLDEEEIEPDLFLEEEMEEEEEVTADPMDLSVPDGISLADPIRMYLKEIGKIPQQRGKLNWQSGWRRVMRRLEKSWQKPISGWWSALPSGMQGEGCSSLI